MRLFIFAGRVAGMRVGFSFDISHLLRRPRSAASASGTGFVYVIQRAPGEVKIGSTRNPPQRLRSLQTGSSKRLRFAFIAATADREAIEQEAIRMLRTYRLHGDWFEVSAEAAAAVVYAAAAKLSLSLTATDPTAATGRVPLQLSAEERHQGNVNMVIVAVALIIGLFTAWKTAEFIIDSGPPISAQTPP